MQLIKAPSFLEPLLKRYLKKTFYAGTRKEGFADREEFTEGDYRFFTPGIQDLNEAFTRERAFLPKNYLNKKEFRSGYIFYFLPVNALKVASLLDQSPLEISKADESAMVKVLDIGSGPGTGAMGSLIYFSKKIRGMGLKKFHLDMTLLDQNLDILRNAEGLLKEAVQEIQKENTMCEIQLTTHLVVGNFVQKNLAQILRKDEYDLILCLNTLNELPPPGQFSLIKSSLDHYLSLNGRVLVMEPALQSTTRNLMELRDALIERKAGFVLAPCLHQAPCPMLRENNRDWCHTYIPWERPAWIEKIDKMVGIKKDYLKCSYLLLGKKTDFQPSESMWRIVSGMLNSKGKSERLLCGGEKEPHYLRLTRQDKDYSEINKTFDQLERGDIVSLLRRERIFRETPLKKV